MTDLNARIEDLFQGYQTAIAESDIPAVASFYADTFMFGSPAGVRCVKKEDFINVLPRREEFFRSAGLVSSKIESLESRYLDSRYVLATAFWEMKFERGKGEPISSQNSSTYILSASDNRFEIVFQIDHQDLMKRAQELGLQ